MTANGRQTSDNVIADYTATMNSPARLLRIDEYLGELVNSGKKMTLADVGALQEDTIDIIARRMAPLML